METELSKLAKPVKYANLVPSAAPISTDLTQPVVLPQRML
jgi:hypothetical protein